MSWGYKIVIVYGTFVAGILFLVYKSSREQTDLVTTNYYEQELKYQDKIEEMKRTASLKQPVSVTIMADSLQVDFENNFTGKPVKGQLHLYFPADEKKDLHRDFNDTTNRFLFALPPANRGLHTIKLSWECGGLNYYLEKKVFI